MSDDNHFGNGRAHLGRRAVLGDAVSAETVAGLPASRVAVNSSIRVDEAQGREPCRRCGERDVHRPEERAASLSLEEGRS
jgi:hypothetical protein